MPNPKIQEILNAVAKSASQVDQGAQKVLDQACPHCGGPLESVDPDHEDQPEGSEDR